MPKNKKTAKKKSVKKTTRKRVVSSRAKKKNLRDPKGTPQGRRKRKDLSPDIIFDSQIGKTDALFVDNTKDTPVAQLPVDDQNEAPDNGNKPKLKIPEVLPKSLLDPAINEALKEFDTLEKEPDVEKINLPPRVQAKPPAQQSQSQQLPDKKSFWQRIFNKK
jgi:hypothetical protein